MKEKTWEELRGDKEGTVYVDEFKVSLRFLILRGPASLCAYVGAPINHPLAGHDYTDLPIGCHGGFTFSARGDDGSHPKGFWWYGWDYAHAGDGRFYDNPLSRHEKKWLVKDVEEDSQDAIFDFITLVRLAEKIAAKERQSTNSALT